MWTGVQATPTIGGGATIRYFTWGWPASRHVLWHVMPVTSSGGSPSLDWDTAVERASQSQCTYWITVTNRRSTPVTFELRFAVMS